MTLRAILACLFALALTAPAAAQAPPDDGPAWAFLVGTWSCTLSNGMGPITVTYTRGSRDNNYLQHVSAPITGGGTYSAAGWISYDPAAKRWVYIAEGSIGDYTVATTPGWHENVLVFTHVLLTGGDSGGTTTLKKSGNAIVDATVVAANGTITQHCVKQ
jgi:hypothetical protein